MPSKYRDVLLAAANAYRLTGDDVAFLEVADRVIELLGEEPLLPWDDRHPARKARRRDVPRAGQVADPPERV